MPLLGLGTWQLTGDTAGDVEHALQVGYRLIDTSGDYGTQPGIGRALRSSSLDRDEIFLVTKVEEDEDSFEAAQRNLQELGQGYVDLLLIHRPPHNGVGEWLWEGMLEAKREGLAREIGVSNYTSRQIDRLVEGSGERPAVNQVEWSPFGHSWDLMEHAKTNGIVIQAYSPLTRGQRLSDETLAEIGERHGKTAAQVILRWCIQVGAPPIPKAARAEHREENLDVFDFELGAAEMDALTGLNEHYSSLAGLPYV
ncbi:MAG TPA: aldo/keto reductase [Solirubrobacterales bacterium]